MSLHRLLVRAALLAGLLLPAACGGLPFDGSCGPEGRTMAIAGDILDAGGTRIGRAEFRLQEIRGDAQPRTLLPLVMGPAYGSAGAPLRGHVTSARLVGPGGRTLFEVPAVPGGNDEVLRITLVPIADEAEFSALRQSFRTGEVVLLLGTDLPGKEQIRTPLPLLHATGWTRASCS